MNAAVINDYLRQEAGWITTQKILLLQIVPIINQVVHIFAVEEIVLAKIALLTNRQEKGDQIMLSNIIIWSSIPLHQWIPLRQ